MTQFIESISGLTPKPQAITRNATVATAENWIRSWDFRSLPSRETERRELAWSWSVQEAFHLNGLEKMLKISTKKDGKQGHSRLREKES